MKYLYNGLQESEFNQIIEQGGKYFDKDKTWVITGNKIESLELTEETKEFYGDSIEDVVCITLEEYIVNEFQELESIKVHDWDGSKIELVSMDTIVSILDGELDQPCDDKEELTEDVIFAAEVPYEKLIERINVCAIIALESLKAEIGLKIDKIDESIRNNNCTIDMLS